MAVTKVSQREIVEVPFNMPDGEVKPHMILVISNERLQEQEDGMFYGVLISSKKYLKEYILEIKPEWLNQPLSKQSYFVTHLMRMFKTSEVIQAFHNYVKEPYYDKVIDKIISSIFGIEVEE